jgi:hypothetical protein
MAKKEISPIDIVLKVFVKQLNKSSAYQYKQVKNAFGIEEAFVLATSAERNFLELLPKLLASDKLLVSDKKETINSIVKGLRNNVLESYKWNRNGLKSYKTYLNTFLNFIVRRMIDDSNIYGEIVKNLKSSNLNLAIDELDEEMLTSNDNGIYKYSTLITTFKTRLNRQERTSGDKIWLPLSFINKIFSVNGRKDYLDWIKDLVDGIHIHYYDKELNCVKDVTIREGGINIKLVKSSDMYSVWLILEKNGEIKPYRVLTPTGRGNNKEPLFIKNSKTLGEIEIDHVKPIDKTLKEKGDSGELKQLQKVTEEFKNLKNRGLEKSVTELNKAARNIIIDLNALKDELNLIKKDSPLRLMAKKYNSQKSNGATFKEYRKTVDNKYIGIIEEGIKMANDEKAKDMTLYQELSNALKGNITIDYNDRLKGEKVNVTDLDINII